MSPKPSEPSSTAHGPVAARLPLSAAQRDIWMAHGLDASGCRYNIGEYREILGDLDPQLLSRAWYQLAREADALRVRGTGADEDGGLWQLVRAEPDDRRLELLDLSGEADPAGAARDRMDAELARPFDLADDWLTRHLLIDAGTAPGGERRWFYFHAFHHLAVDGLGIALMDQRLVELYERGATGEPWGPSPFGTMEALLAEDARYRTSPEAAADRAHWAGHLAGLPQTPRLGEGRSGGTAPGALPFVRRTVVLPPDRADRLRAVARARRAPWAMLVIALVAAYVHRASGSPGPVLGLPVTGRRTELARRTPGMMSNVVPLRVPVTPDGTLAELLAAVVKETRQGLAHQRTRYEDMCRDLGVGESERRITAPLVNIMAFTPGMRFCGFPTTQHNLSNGPVEDLAIGVYDLGPEGGLRIDFDAAPQVCDLAAVAGHQDRFVRFVTTALDSALEVPLSELELLGEAERRQVVEEWTGRRADIGEDTLVDRFEEQARTRPEARALVFGDEELTYGELDTRANRLAHHLAEHGLGRGDLAGVLLDRGTDFAVALLAVLKSGAGYALLDPEFPDERLSGTARDAGVGVLVTDSRHHARVAGPWACVLVDSEAEAIGRQAATGPGVTLTPADTACVMFTSGSTGRPKGILSSHRNLVSTLTAQTYAHFGPDETFLQCSPVSWDAFSLEFWGALLHGGTTVLQPGQRPEPAAIAALAPRRGVTMLQLSSSLFNFLTDEHPESFSTTRIVYTGGEPASPTHVHRLHALYPTLTITNGYGPAESMGFTTTHPIPTSDRPTPTVPIGRPLTNKHVYVLDAHLHPTPPGTTGELYLTGDGLAHGYLAQPTTTATSFLPNPYGPPGSRLYRTGDQAHWDTHGNLHYTGRTDTQIKIRGFRIETTEIETVLTTHPEIAQATLSTHPDHHNTTQLTAYLVATTPDLSGQDVRIWLRTLLPDHMVPAFVVLLDRLPLTPNGKIDKRALPVPEAAATAGGRAPRTELEASVLAHFADALNTTAPLSIDDGFFDLGGHSLLAARLTNRIGAALGVALTLRDVFQHPTPATLAQRIESLRRSAPAAPRRARPALRRRTPDQERSSS